MIGDIDNFVSFNEIKKEKNVTFVNNSLDTFRGKGSMFLKEKFKDENALFVNGLKDNLLNVSQICAQGSEVIFRSKSCVVRNLDTGKVIIKGTRTPRNVYIIEGGKENYFLGNYEGI